VPRHIRWSNLWLGIVAVIGVAVAGVLILTYAGVGSLHGKTFTLFVRTDEARGVIRGTEVWLNGQRVGVVKDVRFHPPRDGVDDRVLMRLDVLESAREHIRTDSRTQIRSGGSLISSPVIYVHSGTVRTRGVVEGDTLASEGPTDFETATTKVAEAAADLPAIIGNAKTLRTQLTRHDGPVASLRGAMPRFRDATTRASRVMERLTSDSGTIGSAVAGRTDAANRARRAMASVDSLRAFIASGQTSFGRFRRDTTLTREITALRAEVATIRQLAANPNGTIGRFRADTAYRQALGDAVRQLDSLMADIKRRPLRYIAF
jgi:phospholipid/cholesterol/gamma-HCH transport system substrate-binding protein